MIIVLVHKCLQQLQLLALHLEMLYTYYLKVFGYLRKPDDLIGDNLTLLHFLSTFLEVKICGSVKKIIFAFHVMIRAL